MNSLSQSRKKLLVQMGIICLGGAALAFILFRFPPDQTRFYPKCLLYATTGLQCPGCGGLRAAHHLLHGHFNTAFHYNPLLILLMPFFAFFAAAFIYARWRGAPVRHPFRHVAWVWILVATILVFSVLRNVAA